MTEKIYYKLALSEILKGIDTFCEKRKIQKTNDCFILTLIQQIYKEAQNLYSSLNYLPEYLYAKSKSACEESYLDSVIRRLIKKVNNQKVKKNLHASCLNEFIDVLMNFQDKQKVFNR